MNPVLRQLLESGTVDVPDGSTQALHSHIDRLEGDLLSAWLAQYAATRVLEIGLAFGVSALFIADALADRPGATHDIIDPHQARDWHGCGLRHLERAGYGGRITFHDEPSELCLPRLLARGYRCDAAFIDGFHTFDQVLVDFYYVNRLLEPGGIVVFDDVHMPSVAEVLRHVAAYPCYEPLVLPASFATHRTVRLRRMMGAPPSRIGGFVKTGIDARPWHWHHVGPDGSHV